MRIMKMAENDASALQAGDVVTVSKAYGPGMSPIKVPAGGMRIVVKEEIHEGLYSGHDKNALDKPMTQPWSTIGIVYFDSIDIIDRKAGSPSGTKTAQNLQFVENLGVLTERETVRGIRDAIVNEQLAIQQYEALADGTADEKSKEVLQDIANEEKVHVGELMSLLEKLDPDEAKSIKDGAKEVERA